MSDNIMLDLETLGTSSDAAIIAIGAVRFDPVTGQVDTTDRFYKVVDLASAVDNGGVIDPATVLWWMKQSDAARAEFNRAGIHINKALNAFTDWLKPTNKLAIWGNGATFDNVIIRTAYNRAMLPTPWHFTEDKCYRTIAAMFPQIRKQTKGTAHNAVDDAESQARHLCEIGQHTGIFL